jgi:hypothetical protein
LIVSRECDENDLRSQASVPERNERLPPHANPILSRRLLLSVEFGHWTVSRIFAVESERQTVGAFAEPLLESFPACLDDVRRRDAFNRLAEKVRRQRALEGLFCVYSK